MDVVAALGLAALLFVKETGVPIPVPGDLLVLGAGVATAGDPAAALTTLLIILVAGYAGGAIQFLVARGALRLTLIALLTRFGVSQSRIDSLAERLRRSGARGVAIARATPGVRVPAIAAAGIAALPMRSFGPGLVTGNTVFVGGHFALGFVVGLPAIAFVQSAGSVLVIGAFVALAILGLVGWLLIVRRRRRAGQSAAFTSWADAACPACLLLGARPAAD